MEFIGINKNKGAPVYSSEEIFFRSLEPTVRDDAGTKEGNIERDLSLGSLHFKVELPDENYVNPENVIVKQEGEYYEMDHEVKIKVEDADFETDKVIDEELKNRIYEYEKEIRQLKKNEKNWEIHCNILKTGNDELKKNEKNWEIHCNILKTRNDELEKKFKIKKSQLDKFLKCAQEVDEAERGASSEEGKAN